MLDRDTIKQVKMKEKKFKDYLWRTRKLLEINLQSRNLIKGLSPLIRYSGPFLKWTREGLQKIDQRKRKKADDDAQSLTSEKCHSRTIYVKKKEGRGVANIEDRVDASKRQLEDYLKKKKQRKTNYNDQKQYKHQQNNPNEETKIGKKQLYWYLKRQTNEITLEKIWTWLRKQNFLRETELLLITAWNNVIRTKQNFIRRNKIANIGYVVIETKRSNSY